MTAKVQAKAEADARKFAAKEERRKKRGGLFRKKKDSGAAPGTGTADAGAVKEAEAPVEDQKADGAGHGSDTDS
jgi:hypothetical protein